MLFTNQFANIRDRKVELSPRALALFDDVIDFLVGCSYTSHPNVPPIMEYYFKDGFTDTKIAELTGFAHATVRINRQDTTRLFREIMGEDILDLIVEDTDESLDKVSARLSNASRINLSDQFDPYFIQMLANASKDVLPNKQAGNPKESLKLAMRFSKDNIQRALSQQDPQALSYIYNLIIGKAKPDERQRMADLLEKQSLSSQA